MACDSSCAAYVGERAIAVIVEEPTWAWLEDPRNAVVAYTGAIGATAERGVELSELADEKVKLPVVVIVEPDGARTPARRGYSSFLCDIGEGTVTIVAVKGIPQWPWRIIEVRFPAVDEVNVHPAIIVKIQESTAGSAGLW